MQATRRRSKEPKLPSAKAILSKAGYLAYNIRPLWACVPKHAFSEDEQDAPPDYSSLAGWCAHPARAPGRAVEDANLMALPGEVLQPASQRPCDCFFVHDSCLTMPETMPYLGQSGTRWNAPVTEAPGSLLGTLAAKVNEQADLRVAAGASCFNRECRVYAPRYRQANVLALYHLIPARRWLPAHRFQDGVLAMDLAYGDVRRAFLQFFHDPATAGRPFVLAGHSQGVFHLVRLLQEEMEGHPERLHRFVHAYLPGAPVPRDLFGRTLRQVVPSRCKYDIRSVSSWRTGGPGHRSPKDIEKLGRVYYSDRGWMRTSSGSVSVSPLTWSDERGTARSDPALHRGAAFPFFENFDPREHVGLLSCGENLRFGQLVARQQGALGLRASALERVEVGNLTSRIDRRGVLRVPRFPVDSLFALCESDWLEYHDVDVALFYGNIRDNVALRLCTWQGRSKL